MLGILLWGGWYLAYCYGKREACAFRYVRVWPVSTNRDGWLSASDEVCNEDARFYRIKQKREYEQRILYTYGGWTRRRE